MFDKIIEKLYFSQKGNLATYDQFTGSLNRNWFERFAKEYSCNYVVVCDINGLKRVNDTMGHNVGDQLILTVSSILKDTFHSEKVIRYGGDEFFILCKESPVDKLESIRSDLFSFGVAERIGSLEEDINRADKRMYQMKGDKKRRA